MAEPTSSSTKLWILEPRRDLTSGDNPWSPWFDKCFGMIVEAASEASARSIAHANCVQTDETRLRDRRAYLEPRYST
ncbi:MAG: hypothetical protein ACLQIB_03300, partial [Isosphaeraceae bacterium]